MSTKIRKLADPATAALNLSVEEVACILGVGRSSAFELIKSGRLKSFKFGRLRRVARDEAERVARELAGGRAA